MMTRKIVLILTAVLSCSCVQKGIEKGAFLLAPGEKGALTPCFVRAHTLLEADVRCPEGFGGVSLQRGDTSVYWGAELHVTPDSVIIRDFDYNEEQGRSMVSVRESFAHGLSISKRLKISISTVEHDLSATLVICAGGQVLKRAIRWHGGGAPTLVNEGDRDIRAKLSFERGAAGEPIWFIGDSYFSEIDPERWPYHMVGEGFTRGWMADHIPGGTSEQMLESFIGDLEYGTPRIAVWMLGMNDADGFGSINGEWLHSTERFVHICDSLCIEAILTVVPSVPGRCHDAKARWVKESGYRFLDWYSAVGASPWVSAEVPQQGWEDALLYEDGVHPTEAGARALWAEVKKRLPELAELQ